MAELSEFWQKLGFTEEDVIHRYIRREALEDAVLVDVTETAKEAGFRWPVALTAGAWALVTDIPKSQPWQDVNGRLWDVIWMGSLAARRFRGNGQTIYKLIMHNGRRKYANLKLHVGPGDNGEPVVTIMLPGED